jgi:hypothetical protein
MFENTLPVSEGAEKSCFFKMSIMAAAAECLAICFVCPEPIVTFR